jgi:hypothetical protein
VRRPWPNKSSTDRPTNQPTTDGAIIYNLTTRTFKSGLWIRNNSSRIDQPEFQWNRSKELSWAAVVNVLVIQEIKMYAVDSKHHLYTHHEVETKVGMQPADFTCPAGCLYLQSAGRQFLKTWISYTFLLAGRSSVLPYKNM